MQGEDLFPYLRLMSSRLNRLEDLVPFGYLSSQRYHNEFHKRMRDFIEIDTVQDTERGNFQHDPWTYKINKYNFRGPFDFKSRKKKKIGFFGCSFTFGEGIKEENTFVDIVGKSLNLNAFNFGIGGSGIERVARTFSAVNNLVDLDIAVITFPGWHRQFHLDEQGNIVNIMPSRPSDRFKELSETLISMPEDYYFVRGGSLINWVCDIAKYKKIKVIYSSWDHSVNSFLRQINPNNTIKPFPNIDDKCARDMMHPGIKSQKAHADQIIEAINDKSWV